MSKFKSYSRQLTWLFMAFLLTAFAAGCGDSKGGQSGDTIAPTVTLTVPAAAATGVPTNMKIIATFSEAMDASSIMATTTMTVRQGATSVSGSVSYVGLVATFTPAANFTGNTQYTATITTGAKDSAGNALASPYVWTFTTGATTDSIVPAVSSAIPSNGATSVAIGGNIAVSFSEPMDASTINSSTMTLTQGITAVPGVVTYVGTTATFNPASNLAANTLYTVTITTGAKDLAGNALAADKTMTFTTDTTDTSAPSVSSTLPANSATGVAVNSNITATFSEAMDPSTVTTSTMTLKQGVTVVPGAVTYVGTTATLNPTSDLVANTLYTATITTGVKNLAGNQLAVAKTWTFTTLAEVAVAKGPSAVDLGTAGNYVILAKTGIDTVPMSAITGNIAVSPAAATYITGFALTADPTNVFSTSTQVTGKVYAANYAVPTPVNLTTAVLNMETAYTNAAGRTTPDFTELHSGDLSGKTLVPGLYKWGTNVLINSDVTLNGGPNDVWIFQIAGDVTQANGTRVILAGGALAKNIFWQVAGGTGVAIGTTAHFEGVILAIKAITLNTGSLVNGRLLSQTAVTLKSSTVTKPAL